jgi:hypothetical protein
MTPKLVSAETTLSPRKSRSDRGKRHSRRSPDPSGEQCAKANRISRTSQWRLETLARHSPQLFAQVNKGKLSAAVAIEWLDRCREMGVPMVALPSKEWLQLKRTRGRRYKVHIPSSRVAAAKPAGPLANADQLIVTNHFDADMAALADRHYSRRTPGTRQFMYSGRKLVIRNVAGTVLFGWQFPDADKRLDGQTGLNCQIFRNESSRLSSTIILECERMAIAKWGPNRMFTYVDPAKIRSVNPGACFLKAGWQRVRNADGSIRTSATGQHLLVKFERDEK